VDKTKMNLQAENIHSATPNSRSLKPKAGLVKPLQVSIVFYYFMQIIIEQQPAGSKHDRDENADGYKEKRL